MMVGFFLVQQSPHHTAKNWSMEKQLETTYVCKHRYFVLKSLGFISQRILKNQIVKKLLIFVVKKITFILSFKL